MWWEAVRGQSPKGRGQASLWVRLTRGPKQAWKDPTPVSERWLAVEVMELRGSWEDPWGSAHMVTGHQKHTMEVAQRSPNPPGYRQGG